MAERKITIDKITGTAEVLQQLADAVHQTHVDKGFHEVNYSLSHRMGMAMTELAEVIELERNSEEEFVDYHGNQTDKSEKSEKIPEHTKLEEEIADAILRLLDTASQYNCNIGGAIVAKAKYNESRPYKHGRQY